MSQEQLRPVRVGLLGIGTVGGGTFTELKRNQEEIRRRAGRGIEVTMVADLNTALAQQVVGDAAQIVSDARAVIATRAGTLRSIPTEAETSQKTSTLAAGNIAVADRAFLGWTHLTFENGQTGWVRKEEVVPLWSGTK